MTRRTRQILLGGIAAALAVILLLFLADRDVARDHTPPRDLEGMTRWIAEHPADWLTAAQISDNALDSSLPRRGDLWRASYALAQHLAPRRRNAQAAFVQGGLFHWYELSGAERKTVLDTAAPLLSDPRIFGDLHGPLWQLTHDFDYLLHNAPKTLTALDELRTMAAANGLFREYRDMRAAMVRMRLTEFETARTTLAPHELTSVLPPHLDADEEPLVRAILAELQRQSYEPSQFHDRTEQMIDYAVTHHLQPLDALTPFIEAVNVISDLTRARLAVALNRPDTATLIELSSATADTPEWIPYRVERALFEARQGNAAAADAQLRRASMQGFDVSVLAAAEQCAAIARNAAAAAQYGRQLAEAEKQPRNWRETCGRNELCDRAQTRVYSGGQPIVVTADVVQSDRIPPYLEVYVDDARVAEGEVNDERAFALPAARGAHRIEVRLANPRVANGSQRRVRLS